MSIPDNVKDGLSIVEREELNLYQATLRDVDNSIKKQRIDLEISLVIQAHLTGKVKKLSPKLVSSEDGAKQK